MAFDLPQGGPSQPVSPYIGTSQAAYGAVTAPAADAVIATLTPGAGDFEISVVPDYSGTAETIADNMNLRVGGTVVARLIVPPSASGRAPRQRFPQVTVGAGQAITVNGVATPTAGAIYRAQIVATPVP